MANVVGRQRTVCGVIYWGLEIVSTFKQFIVVLTKVIYLLRKISFNWLGEIDCKLFRKKIFKFNSKNKLET